MVVGDVIYAMAIAIDPPDNSGGNDEDQKHSKNDPAVWLDAQYHRDHLLIAGAHRRKYLGEVTRIGGMPRCQLAAYPRETQ